MDEPCRLCKIKKIEPDVSCPACAGTGIHRSTIMRAQAITKDGSLEDWKRIAEEIGQNIGRQVAEAMFLKGGGTPEGMWKAFIPVNYREVATDQYEATYPAVWVVVETTKRSSI